MGQSYLLCPLGRVKTELLAELKLPLQPHLIHAFSGRLGAVSQVSIKTDFYSPPPLNIYIYNPRGHQGHTHTVLHAIIGKSRNSEI